MAVSWVEKTAVYLVEQWGSLDAMWADALGVMMAVLSAAMSGDWVLMWAASMVAVKASWWGHEMVSDWDGLEVEEMDGYLDASLVGKRVDLMAAVKA